MPILNFPLHHQKHRQEARAAAHPAIRITPFGAAVPARPMPPRRAARRWVFDTVAWLTCAGVIALSGALLLMITRLIEIERALELAARV